MTRQPVHVIPASGGMTHLGDYRENRPLVPVCIGDYVQADFVLTTTDVTCPSCQRRQQVLAE
jgi:hypothetical protein